jgi:regulatory protein
MEKKEGKVLAEAMFWAGRRERSPAEVRDYLQGKGLEGTLAEEIAETLQREGYTDPSRFAAAYVNDKFRFNQWGRLRLRLELRQRGITEEIAASALNSIAEDEYVAVIDKHLETKRKQLKDLDRLSLLHKLTTFAVRKGFEPALVRERALLLFP